MIYIGFVLVLASAGKKDANGQSGSCYCDFANGDTQEDELTTMWRQEQIAKCDVHSTNAGSFGGHCELE